MLAGFNNLARHLVMLHSFVFFCFHTSVLIDELLPHSHIGFTLDVPFSPIDLLLWSFVGRHENYLLLFPLFMVDNNGSKWKIQIYSLGTRLVNEKCIWNKDHHALNYEKKNWRWKSAMRFGNQISWLHHKQSSTASKAESLKCCSVIYPVIQHWVELIINVIKYA